MLQDHEYSRVGGRDILKADVRILAATNQDLEKAVKEKRFREDLYFRLKVIPIHLPPLRERRGDIPLLIGYFIDKINREMGIQISGISPEAQKLLEDHSWPGNVRELENTLIRAAVLSSGPILFPKDFTLQNKPAATTLEVDQLSLEEIIRHKLEDYFRRIEGVDVDNLYSLVIERIERPLIELTLKKNQGNQIRAARYPRHQPQHPAQKDHRPAHRAEERVRPSSMALTLPAALRHPRSGADQGRATEEVLRELLRRRRHDAPAARQVAGRERFSRTRPHGAQRNSTRTTAG